MPKSSSSLTVGQRPGKRRELDMNRTADGPHDEGQVADILESLKTTLDDLRATLQCKICFRMLYEPYTLTCGHTYCYTCLCKWFDKSRKTCPDCRSIITEQPAPSYLVRDLTSKFLSHDYLLPDGETVLQHTIWQKEEADQVEKDRSTTEGSERGLFNGQFARYKYLQSRRSLVPLHDAEDGVDRCPHCAWELEDGRICTRCDYNGSERTDDSESELDGPSDQDSMEYTRNQLDLDEEIDMEDQEVEDDFNAYDMDGTSSDASESQSELHRVDAGQYNTRPISSSSTNSQYAFSDNDNDNESDGDIESEDEGVGSNSEEEEEEDDDADDDDDEGDDSSMRDFIDNEAEDSSSMAAESEENESEPNSESTTTAAWASHQPSQARGRIPVIESDSDEEPEELPIQRSSRQRRRV